MKIGTTIAAALGAASICAVVAFAAPPRKTGFDADIAHNAQTMLDEGKKTFRFETFGSEAFWGDALQLHKAIAGEKNGGVGPGVSPKTALSVGLKVDADALPEALKKQLAAGKVNLDDPATTLALLKLNAVVGVTAFTNPDGSVRSMGIQCAFCHSTVDNSFAPGIGMRLDGWANRDLNVGAIVSLSPNLKPFTDLLGVDAPTVKRVLGSWGPGRFDAELDKDGKAFRPDGKCLATAGDDSTVKVWDAATGREMLTLRGHTQGVLSVAWHPDGKRLASASRDQTVKVWDAVTGKEILSLRGHTSFVWSVAWSPDGTRLVSAGADRTIRVHDATRGYALER